MSVSIYVEVSGRTYDVKEKLKVFGLRWDGDRKVWKGTVSEKELRKLSKLADKFQIEIKTRTRKRHKTYEDKRDLLEKFYASKSTNSTWVRCWECGRLIPPGQATKDVNGGWYCGC